MIHCEYMCYIFYLITHRLSTRVDRKSPGSSIVLAVTPKGLAGPRPRPCWTSDLIQTKTRVAISALIASHSQKIENSTGTLLSILFLLFKKIASTKSQIRVTKVRQTQSRPDMFTRYSKHTLMSIKGSEEYEERKWLQLKFHIFLL